MTRILLSRRWDTMTMKLRSLSGVLPLTVALLCLPALAVAQNPCQTPITQQTVLTSVNAKLYAELDDHNRRLPDDSDFATREYRYQEYDATSGNPVSGPFLNTVTVSRAGWTLAPGTSNCYGATVALSTSTPRWAVLKGVLTAVGNGSIPDSAPSDASNPFFLALLRVGAVRRGQ